MTIKYKELWDVAYLEEALRQSKTNTDIARDVGCDLSSVGIALRRAGLASNRRACVIPYDTLYQALAVDKRRLSDVAREYGCTSNGVKYRANKLGIDYLTNVSLDRELLATSLHELGSYARVAKALNRTPEHICRSANSAGLSISQDFPRVSSTEIDLRNFCSSLGKPLLVQEGKLSWDIVFTQNSVAVELDGVYWHSDGVHRNKFNIRDKHNKSRDAGVRTIHIFDVEWVNKREICEGIIRSAVKAPVARFYARKLRVVRLDANTTREFLRQNHIQGWCVYSVSLGLVDDDGTVLMCATFGKSRSTKEEWEFLRLCSKRGCAIAGGAARLFRNFVREYSPESVVSFCSRRLFSGGVYSMLGFTLTRTTPPGYFYSKHGSGSLESRNKYQKYKLKDIFDNYDESLTEYENMLNNKYRRVWDAGNDVYVWHAP